MPAAVRDAAEGAIYEAGLAATQALSEIGRRIAANTGALLAIDYGYAATQTDETLQAVSRHQFADPLDHPGEIDLSAHVDFGALAEAAQGLKLKTLPLATQGDFLRRLGINERAAQLARANPGEAASIAAALERLTAPAAMGDLFKVFCTHSSGLEPFGFA
jgi:NADH dehydrogenase [ubiquinone] 1 alpha subcomplex assembly factor 7